MRVPVCVRVCGGGGEGKESSAAYTGKGKAGEGRRCQEVVVSSAHKPSRASSAVSEFSKHCYEADYASFTLASTLSPAPFFLYVDISGS